MKISISSNGNSPRRSSKLPVFLLRLSLAAIVGIFASCSAPKNIVYLEGIRDTSYQVADTSMDIYIQKNDILGIGISSLNPEASAVFNSVSMPSATTGVSNSSDAKASGFQGISYKPGSYLVNYDGKIALPLIGSFKVAGLTKNQLSDTLVKVLTENKYLVDPIVTVNFLNFRVTVLGEVNRPGVVTVDNEKINILEALGIAGDLNIYAERSTVLLIRQENGKKTITRIDLTSKKLLESEYFHLKTNDIIYAEPNKEKAFSISNTKNSLPIILSGLSLLAVLINTIVTISK